MNTNHDRIKCFEDILRENYSYLQRFIYSLARRDNNAMEEIFQRTMVNCVENLHTLQDESKMKAWMFSIAKTEAARYYSKKTPVTLVELTDELEAYDSDEPIRFSNCMVEVENKDLILKLLSKFNPLHQQIFVLHYHYGITFPEISKILNMNLNTVSSIHLRGLAKMRDTMDVKELKKD